MTKTFGFKLFGGDCNDQFQKNYEHFVGILLLKGLSFDVRVNWISSAARLAKVTVREDDDTEVLDILEEVYNAY